MLRFLDGGESHGKALVAIIEGFPANFEVDLDFINKNLLLRQSGYGRGGRQKIERDKVEILSGVRFSKTLASPITMLIPNKDYENWQNIMAAFGEKSHKKRITKPRPGHADLAGYLKYNFDDMRNVLERSSARNTAIRVAVGSLCEQALEKLGIKLVGFVEAIGKIKANIDYYDNEIEKKTLKSPVFCPDESATFEMIAEIEKTKLKGDTLGGVVVVMAKGVPAGLGSYVFYDRRLDGRLAMALMSIQAVKAVEIGDGIKNAFLTGSEVHDEIIYENGQYKRLSNRAGGIEGGMSNGEDIIVKAYMKPIPTLIKGLRSVDVLTKAKSIAAFERSDVCATPALSIVAKSAVAIELFNAVLEKFGNDDFEALKKAFLDYKESLKNR